MKEKQLINRRASMCGLPLEVSVHRERGMQK
jgi:hypothetical protein